jgi:hypothetical protein
LKEKEGINTEITEGAEFAEEEVRVARPCAHRDSVFGFCSNPRNGCPSLARKGHKVMQFLAAGRYVGVVVDGEVVMYGGKKKTRS